MASQTRSAGLGQSVAKASGIVNWSSPTNIYASDDSRANCHPTPDAVSSHYLRATTFGFTIPDGATIDGIKVEIEKNCTRVSMRDWQVKIVRAGSEGGTNKADTVTDWPSTDTYVSYGGATDKWGWASWLVAQINASNFGVSVSVTYGGIFTTAYAYVDHIRITVYYTEAVGTNMKINIGDVFKDADEVKINVGDSWKPGVKAWQNVGDVWKVIFG